MKLDFSKVDRAKRIELARKIFNGIKHREVAKIELVKDTTTLYRKREFDDKQSNTKHRRPTGAFTALYSGDFAKMQERSGIVAQMKATFLEKGVGIDSKQFRNSIMVELAYTAMFKAALPRSLIASAYGGSSSTVQLDPSVQERDPHRTNLRPDTVKAAIRNFRFAQSLSGSKELFKTRGAFDLSTPNTSYEAARKENKGSDVAAYVGALEVAIDESNPKKLPAVKWPICFIPLVSTFNASGNRRPTKGYKVSPEGIRAAAYMFAGYDESKADTLMANLLSRNGGRSFSVPLTEIKALGAGSNPASLAVAYANHFFDPEPVKGQSKRQESETAILHFSYSSAKHTITRGSNTASITRNIDDEYADWNVMPDSDKDGPVPVAGGWLVTIELHPSKQEYEYLCQTSLDRVLADPSQLYTCLQATVRGYASATDDESDKSIAPSMDAVYADSRAVTYNDLPDESKPSISSIYILDDGHPIYVPVDLDNYPTYSASISATMKHKHPNSNILRIGFMKSVRTAGGENIVRRSPSVRSDPDYLSKIQANTYIFSDFANGKVLYTDHQGLTVAIDLDSAHPFSHTLLANILKSPVRIASGYLGAIIQYYKHVNPGNFQDTTVCQYLSASFNEPDNISKNIGLEDALTKLEEELGIPYDTITVDQLIQYDAGMKGIYANNDVSTTKASIGIVAHPLSVLTRMKAAAMAEMLSLHRDHSNLVNAGNAGAASLHPYGLALATVNKRNSDNSRFNDTKMQYDPEVELPPVPFMRGFSKGENMTVPPHQTKVMRKLAHGPTIAILAVDAGGGKTPLIIHDYLKLLKSGKIKRALFLMPGPIVPQFAEEITTFTGGGVNVIPITSGMLNSKSLVAHGDFSSTDDTGAPKAAGDENWGIERLEAAIRSLPINSVVIADFEAISSDARTLKVGYGSSTVHINPTLTMLRRCRFDYCVVDEAHKLSTSKGNKTRTVMTLLSQATYKRLATGTLVANRIQPIATIVAQLDPTVLGSERDFARAYPPPVRGAKLKKLMEILRTKLCFIQARRVEWQELIPPVKRTHHKLRMSTELMNAYLIEFNNMSAKLDEIKQGRIDHIMAGSGTQSYKQNEVKKVEELFAAVDRGDLSVDKIATDLKKNVQSMKRLANIGIPEAKISSPKLTALVDICVDHIRKFGTKDASGAYVSTNEKIIIFCNEYKERDAIFRALKASSELSSLSGGKDPIVLYTATQKGPALAAFKNDATKLIMVGIQSSMNTGLNLQHASRLIRFTPVIKPADEEQGDARIVRPVYSKKDPRNEINIDTLTTIGTADEMDLIKLRAKINEATGFEVANNEFAVPDDFLYPPSYTGTVSIKDANGLHKDVPAAGRPIEITLGPFVDKNSSVVKMWYINKQNYDAWKAWKTQNFAPQVAPTLYDHDGNPVQWRGKQEQPVLEPDFGYMWLNIANNVQKVPSVGLSAARDSLYRRIHAAIQLANNSRGTPLIPGLFEPTPLTDSAADAVILKNTAEQYRIWLTNPDVPEEDKKKLTEIFSNIPLQSFEANNSLFQLTEVLRSAEYETYINEKDDQGNFLNRLPRSDDGKSFKLKVLLQEAPPEGSALLRRTPYSGGNVYSGADLGLVNLNTWWNEKGAAISAIYADGAGDLLSTYDRVISELSDGSLSSQDATTQIGDATLMLVQEGKLPESGYTVDLLNNLISSLVSRKVDIDGDDSIKEADKTKTKKFIDVVLKDVGRSIIDIVNTDIEFLKDGKKYPAISELRFDFEGEEFVANWGSKARRKGNKVTYDKGVISLPVVSNNAVEFELTVKMSYLNIITRKETSAADIMRHRLKMAGMAVEHTKGVVPGSALVMEASDDPILDEFFTPISLEEPVTDNPAEDTIPTPTEIIETDVTEVEQKPDDETPPIDPRTKKPVKTRIKDTAPTNTKENKGKKPADRKKEKKPSVELEFQIVNGVVALAYEGTDKPTHAFLRSIGYHNVPDNMSLYFKTLADAADAFSILADSFKAIEEKAASFGRRSPFPLGTVATFARSADLARRGAPTNAVIAVAGASKIANVYKMVGTVPKGIVPVFPIFRIVPGNATRNGYGICVPTVLGAIPAAVQSIQANIIANLHKAKADLIVPTGQRAAANKWVIDKNPNDCFKFFASIDDAVLSIEALKSMGWRISNEEQLTRDLGRVGAAKQSKYLVSDTRDVDVSTM